MDTKEMVQLVLILMNVFMSWTIVISMLFALTLLVVTNVHVTLATKETVTTVQTLMNAEVKHTSVILKQFVIIQLEDILASAEKALQEMEKCALIWLNDLRKVITVHQIPFV